MFENILLRKGLATCVFALAFLLTPRAWVEDNARRESVETIPVEVLERTSEQGPCLWCAPLKPVDCEVDGDGEPSEKPERLWLNPDEPPPLKDDATPCITPPKEDDAPSA